MKGRVLVIAGSDPSGGAGVQADVKTVTALGGYAATAITALTVQNTKGVAGFDPVSPALIRAQIDAVMDDVGADAVKIGMIGDDNAAQAVVEALDAWARAIPVVIDPVLAATGGEALARDGVAQTLRAHLVPRATLMTPNIDEAAALTGLEVCDRETMIAAGRAMVNAGAGAVLATGGHLPGSTIEDILVTDGGVDVFETDRIETTSTHGTGCTLASACAVGLAQGLPLAQAVERAVGYVQEAIRTAPGYGAGRGPLNHAHTVRTA